MLRVLRLLSPMLVCIYKISHIEWAVADIITITIWGLYFNNQRGERLSQKVKPWTLPLSPLTPLTALVAAPRRGWPTRLGSVPWGDSTAVAHSATAAKCTNKGGCLFRNINIFWRVTDVDVWLTLTLNLCIKNDTLWDSENSPVTEHLQRSPIKGRRQRWYPYRDWLQMYNHIPVLLKCLSLRNTKLWHLAVLRPDSTLVPLTAAVCKLVTA